MIRAAVDGAVATLTLDAPPLNLLGHALRAAVRDALADRRTRRVRAVVVTGAGRAFSAGADLRDEAQLTRETVRAFLAADEEVFTALAEYPGATIAAINGYAYGGGLEPCARLPLAAAVAYERGEWARLQRTADHREALAAFFGKRAPVFTGA